MKLSPVNMFPRLRPACAELSAGDRAPAGGVRPGDLDLEQAVNRAVLRGVMVNEPLPDTSRGGDPITVLQLSFPAPDDRARSDSALREVEVPDEIADRHRGQLRLGATVLVVGELTGAGGLWADFLAVKTPRGSAG